MVDRRVGTRYRALALAACVAALGSAPGALEAVIIFKPLPVHRPPVRSLPVPRLPVKPLPGPDLSQPLKVPADPLASPKAKPDLTTGFGNKGTEKPSLLTSRTPPHVKQLLAEGAGASGGLFVILHITRVEDPVRSAFYRVESYGSPARYIDTASGLVDEANRIGSGTQAESVYIFVDGPTRLEDRRNLEISLRNQKSRVQLPLVVAGEPLSPSLTTNDLTSAIAGPATLSPLGRATKIADGYHQRDAQLTTGQRSFKMSILGTSRVWIDKFFEILRRLFAEPDNYQSLSTLAVVQLARVELAEALGVTLAQVNTELGINIENSQIAGLFGVDATFAMSMVPAP